MPLPPKLWFQWQRLKKIFGSSIGAEGTTPTSTVRMCPHCRALIDRDAKVCPLCGEATGPRRARGSSSTPGRIMGVLPIPTTATSVIVVANLALYALSWYLTQNTEAAQLYGAPSMGGIDGHVLMRLGAKAPYILAGSMVAPGDGHVPARRPAPHRNEHVVPRGSGAGSGIAFRHHQIHRALPGDGGRGIHAEHSGGPHSECQWERPAPSWD